MKSNLNLNDNTAKAINTQTYKNVIEAIKNAGIVKEINPSVINFMPEKDTYYISHNCMGCGVHIPFDMVDNNERLICQSAFGGWAIWGTYEAHV